MAVRFTDKQEREAISQCEAFQKVRTTNGYSKVASILLILLTVIASILIFVPWQQSVTGVGKVSVFSPMDRPQTIQAQISGRLVRWHVREGQAVEKGQLLLELSEIDPKYLDPQQITRLESQKSALMARRDATQTRIDSLKNQLSFLGESRGVAIPSASVKVRQAGQKIIAAEQAVTAARQNHHTTALNLKRLQELNQRGLRSNRDLELAEQANIEAQTKVEQAMANLNVARQDQSVASYDQAKITADTAAGLSSTQATLSSAYETLASTTSDIAKLDVEIASLQQRIAQRKILAPKAGTVVRILRLGNGENITEGETLATLLPKTQDQAVEMLISDNDAPLVALGRKVRLQFAGWPAIQFTGWPMVAVGTFAGKVTVIDAVDDGTSRYRVMVKPDFEAIQKGREQRWPSSQYLRPGSEALGWIMLDTVPLWYELWRQFNAFPPTVSMEPLSEQKQALKEKSYDALKQDIKKPKKK